MDTAIPVLTVDLAESRREVIGLGTAKKAHILFMYGDEPLGRYEVAVYDGRITLAELLLAIREVETAPRSERTVWSRFVELALLDLMGKPVVRETAPLPPCTVVICTRDRPADLRRCLEALAPSIAEDVEVLVVDNDPPDDQTRDVAALYPVRYCRQARRGLNWARVRGARLARHELVLYMDDDVVVSRSWVNEMRRGFCDENVGAVTGAVEPLELSTAEQYDHEKFSSFYRGFEIRRYNLLTWVPAAAGQAGAGASMAVRKHLALELEPFDAELDGGTAAKSGGDFYGLYRILHAGYSVVYTPRALSWHRHRKTHGDLERMLYGYAVGAYCVLLNVLLRERDPDALVVGIWFVQYYLRELCRSLLRRPGSRQLRVIAIEFRGIVEAPLAYWKCRRKERRMGRLPDNAAEA